MYTGLKSTLMRMVGRQVFPDSESFGAPDDETSAKKCVRVLIEALDIPTMLSAINALTDEFGEES